MTDRKKVLILDDEEEILELLLRILGNKYILLTKTNTENLEKDVIDFQPDAIMIDHFIGNKTSKDIITKSLKNLKNVPIILHSAHEEIERLSRDSNVTAYIRKPSGINEIRDCVARVLNEH